MTLRHEAPRFEAEALPHAEALFRFARRLTGNDADAEDLAQETCVRAFRSFGSYTSGTNCRAWLFRIMHNLHMSRGRRKSVRPFEESLDDTEEFVLYDRLADERPAFRDDPQSILAERGFSERVSRALDQLPEDYRVALLLCDVEGLSYAEIGDIVGIPPGTVASRISRARSRLQRLLLAPAAVR